MSTESYPLVGVIMGSQSDWPVMKKTCETLDSLGISNEARILSAHRKPEKLLAYVGPAREQGMKVVIGGAGGRSAFARCYCFDDSASRARRADVFAARWAR